MNINELKTPAIIFAAGGGAFYFEHFHRSILEHGYHVGLVAAGVGFACWLNNKAKKPEQTIIYREVPATPIGWDKVEADGHKLNVGQKTRVQG